MINTFDPSYQLEPNVLNEDRVVKNIAKPLVSVIIPVYNTGEIMKETLSSVLNQTFQNFEIILVNDCSTDSLTLELLALYIKKFPNKIKVHNHKVNKGLAATRNSGAAVSNADFLFFIDSDDIIEATTLENWFWNLVTHPEYSFVNSYTVGFGAQEYLWDKGFFRGKDFLEENYVICISLIRKSAFKKVGGYSENLKGGLEDWDFWIKSAALNHWGNTIPLYQTWYRRKEDTSDWDTWNNKEKYNEFKADLKQKYEESVLKLKLPNANETITFSNKKYRNRLALNRPNILVILPWLEMGGADKFNLEFIRKLKGDYNFTIVTTLKADNKWLKVFSEQTDDIHLMGDFLNQNQYEEYIEYMIKSRDSKIVLFSNSEYGYDILPLLKVKFPDIPMMDYIHMEEEHWKNGGYPRMSVNNTAFLDKTLVTSEYLKKWCVDRGGRKDITDVVYINIDAELWKPKASEKNKLREELNLPIEKTIILFSGRFVDQKQPLVLLDTIKRLKEKNVDFLAILCGDGPLRGDMDNFINKHEIQDKVWIMGAIANTIMPKYINSCDIFFLPSQHEGIAFSVYEAMACGKVVVGAKVGGQAELVDKTTGFLIEKSTPAKEAQQYSEILEDIILNPSKLDKMSENSRKRIESSFDVNMMSERMKFHFDHLIKTGTKKMDNEEINTLFYQLIKDKIELKQSVEDLWSQKVSLESSLQKGNLESDQIPFDSQLNPEKDKVIEWYHKEYEVLPLWYKRIGHLIKVVLRKKDVKEIFPKK